jgi:formylglycine-generating enzyme required for sulfatase activity
VSTYPALSRRTKIFALAALAVFSATIFFLGRHLLNRSIELQSAAKEQPDRTSNAKTFNGHIGVEVNGALTPELVEVPAGTFLMGSSNDIGSVGEHPQHKVKVAGFLMARFEITNAQYMAFCQATKHKPPMDPHWIEIYARDYPDYPVVNITYQEGLDYCQWLSKVIDKEARLPTEAEWEYAAQGSTPGTTLEIAGQELLPTTKVGSYQPNKLGLYDMLGNVWEWCSDWYDVSYYQQSPEDNPRGPETGDSRVIRGGSWAESVKANRVTNRSHGLPDGESPTIGFRVVAQTR